jgi:hypothetical protein
MWEEFIDLRSAPAKSRFASERRFNVTGLDQYRADTPGLHLAKCYEMAGRNKSS